VWEEDGKYPDLIIELLSDSTEDVDREIKLELYILNILNHRGA
jgi:Uma2 family endonuclease